jgi:hypothetical protein
MLDECILGFLNFQIKCIINSWIQAYDKNEKAMMLTPIRYFQNLTKLCDVRMHNQICSIVIPGIISEKSL